MSKKKAQIAAIEAILAKNAELLGEKLDIGVHVLKDGRVRVYALEGGWRRGPFKEYDSLERASWAAIRAAARAQTVADLMVAGMGQGEAIHEMHRREGSL